MRTVKTYLIYVAVIVLLLSSVIYQFYAERNTSGIAVTDSGEMICESSAQQQPNTLRRMICDFKDIPLKNNKARADLYRFTLKTVDHWTVNRPDIALFFYRRIIAAEPDDTLSIYLLDEKIHNLKQPE